MKGDEKEQMGVLRGAEHDPALRFARRYLPGYRPGLSLTYPAGTTAITRAVINGGTRARVPGYPAYLGTYAAVSN
eukprot:2123237-Rhodomonas_salina.1